MVQLSWFNYVLLPLYLYEKSYMFLGAKVNNIQMKSNDQRSPVFYERIRN